MGGTSMIEAMKQALEALECALSDDRPYIVQCKEAITSLQQAIAELESQEPVAWITLQKEAQQIVESKILWKRFIDGTPLANDIACWMADFVQQYAYPPQRTWVGLTDEEVVQCQQGNIYHFYRCIEAKLKEKNNA